MSLLLNILIVCNLIKASRKDLLEISAESEQAAQMAMKEELEELDVDGITMTMSLMLACLVRSAAR